MPYRLPEIMLQAETFGAAIAVWLLLVVYEFMRFNRAWEKSREQLIQHEKQVTELFDSKRELGTRVRTYSDHADKLKLFISDKLLEYIEYDEKFLHFKNIASEVRHNGVISYDKTQTALKKALELCQDNQQKKEFKEAADSLLYLWDLLDIATTDNITLHVANRIYDSEEYYFQSMLNKSDTSTFPFTPTFTMFGALQRALLPIVDDPESLRTIDQSNYPFHYQDDSIHALISDDCEMLGNQNHMVLLLENLLNNAAYYAGQISTRNKYNRVAIRLSRRQDQVAVEVYNRGPRIKDEDRNRIFQLGYSSRRIRDHHGKGLGLYFVNEICKGFEGSVDFENVENQKLNLSLNIALKDGTQETHFIAMTEDNGKPLCHIKHSGQLPDKILDWSYDKPIARVELKSEENADPQLLSGMSGKQDYTLLDSSEVLLSRWIVEINNRKKSAKLIFRPLDVRGVRFRVKFPTAVSRLEGQDGDD